MLHTYVANAQKFVILVLKNVKNTHSMEWNLAENVPKPAAVAPKNAEKWLLSFG